MKHTQRKRAARNTNAKDLAEKGVKAYQDVIQDAMNEKRPKKRTHILFVLDESGSMDTGKDITIKGYNEQVDIVRASGDDGGETSISLLKFNYELRWQYQKKSVSGLAPLTEQSYVPNGGTALYDAIGSAIAAASEFPGAEDDETAVLVAIFTDGMENSSRTWVGPRLEQLRRDVSRLQETGRWTFTLLGPKQGLSSLADLLAIDRSNVAGFDPGSLASRQHAFASMSGATGTYLSARSVGMTAASNLYAQPKDFAVSPPGFPTGQPTKASISEALGFPREPAQSGIAEALNNLRVPRS
jgi:hypothetical protein